MMGKKKKEYKDWCYKDKDMEKYKKEVTKGKKEAKDYI